MPRQQQYIIGLDMGTTSTKAIAFTKTGKVKTFFQSVYSTLHPQPGYSEQDPELILQAVIDCIREVVKDMKYAPIGICFSSAMHSVIAVNKNGKAITPLITWADARSRKEANAIKKSKNGSKIYYRSGTPIHPMSPLCKIKWIKKNQPEIFKKTFKFISIKEYVCYHFFGKYLIDYSIASASGLFDIEKKQWLAESLRAAGIKTNHLSQPVSTTHIIKGLKKNIEKKLGIPSNIPFIIGASDGCLANVGTNTLRKGHAAITIGTSAAVRMITSRPVKDKKQGLFNYILADDKYVAGGPLNSGGIVLQWYKRHFVNEDKKQKINYKELVKEAVEIDAGAEGLICLPYIQGERAPVWDSQARGLWIGATIHHTQYHFMRALLEGICYAVYSVGKSVEDLITPIQHIEVSGGFVQSLPWVQMLADIFQKKVHITSTTDASSAGAAILGFVALGIFKNLEQAEKVVKIKKTLQPDKRLKKVYHDTHALFEKVYEKNKSLFPEIILMQEKYLKPNPRPLKGSKKKLS